jgi:hypothetical protein
VAGAITSTARQLGAALGIALAGGLVTAATPAGLAHASRPGWVLVAACGGLLLLLARTARPKESFPSPASPPTRQPAGPTATHLPLPGDRQAAGRANSGTKSEPRDGR